MKQKAVSNEELARMVQRGFAESKAEISDLRETMTAGFRRHDREFAAIRKRLDHVVDRREFKRLEDRVLDLENTLAMPPKNAAA
jgi:hypothetical protein